MGKTAPGSQPVQMSLISNVDPLGDILYCSCQEGKRKKSAGWGQVLQSSNLVCLVDLVSLVDFVFLVCLVYLVY